MALEEVRELLARERRLKQQLAERPVVPEAAEVRTTLSDTSIRIAAIIGAFVGEATGHFISAQQ